MRTIDEIHAALQRGEHISPGHAIQYAQHHASIAVADEREACARIAARVHQRPGQGITASNVAMEIETAIRNRSNS